MDKPSIGVFHLPTSRWCRTQSHRHASLTQITTWNTPKQDEGRLGFAEKYVTAITGALSVAPMKLHAVVETSLDQ
jgi:hypothetical protein